jgi:hypothetical protein
MRTKGGTDMKRVFSGLMLVIFLCSCASHKVVHQSNLTYDLESQKNKVSENGVDLMTKPIHLKSELKTYFDQDLLKDRILPVQVSITNNSDEEFYLSTDGIYLTDPSQNNYHVLPVDDVIEKAKKSYWRTAGWGVAFGLLGAVPSLINVSSTNKKIKADYESRVLKSGKMPHGAVTEGLVFFAVPENMTTLDGWEFKLAYQAASGNGLTTIGCCLVGQIEKREAASERDSSIN